MEHRSRSVRPTTSTKLPPKNSKNGPFQSWDDVKQVPGFEDRIVENLQQAGLTIGHERTTDSRNETPPEGRSEHRRSGGESERPGSGEWRGGGLDNAASAEELERVFQIDGTRAGYLVEARKRIGGFKSWEDVKREVPSFEDGMVENLKQAGARIGNKAV